VLVSLLFATIQNCAEVAGFAPRNCANQQYQRHRHGGFLCSSTEVVQETGPGAAAVDENDNENNETTLPSFFPSLATPLKTLGFSKPTPIQSASAQRALDLENLLLIAPTGSGKTLSYMLPVLEKVVKQQHAGNSASTVLVVAPTRELALQLMRDTTSILANGNREIDSDNDLEVLLAVQGVQIPSTEELNSAKVLIGTPRELLFVLSEIKGGMEFVAGDVLSSVVLDEVDVLLPNPPKQLRTALDTAGNARKEKKGGNKFNTPQDERRRQEQKRKFLAAKRKGVEFTSDKQIVGPTEKILKIVANRRLYTASSSGQYINSCQVLAGSATASRKTLDRLNKALRDAAMDSSSNIDDVWNGLVKPCRPEEVVSNEETSSNDNQQEQQEESSSKDHTIRAVTVPSQVKHQYIRLGKDVATKPQAVLEAVVRANNFLKSKRALLFLCGEFGKQKAAQPSAKKNIAPQGKKIQRKGRQKTLKQKKLEAAAASRAKQPVQGLSARSACKALCGLGIEAKPLHVVLGLDGYESENEDEIHEIEIPPILVTFEGSARGLHLDDVDTVFVVGRPSSAASYLHLAGRVGRSSVSEDGSILVRPGNVVSFCTAGSSKELRKWTKQVGGTELEEILPS